MLLLYLIASARHSMWTGGASMIGQWIRAHNVRGIWIDSRVPMLMAAGHGHSWTHRPRTSVVFLYLNVSVVLGCAAEPALYRRHINRQL